MQLHVCLLLFLLTADEIRASDQRCGGNVSLDQQPGYIKLSLPELFNNSWTLDAVTQQSGTLQNCTWGLDVPSGKTVLLKLEWSEDGTRISVRCVGSKDRVLRSGDTALLSGCDRNKATLSWTGGRSSDSLQLLYFVWEDEWRNSSEDWAQTGTIVTKTATVAQKGVKKSTEEGRSRFYEGLVGSFNPRFASSASSQDKGLLHPSSPLQGLPVSGRADTETLPLPEEKLNNGAETSGASHLTSDSMSAQTLPYFHHAIRSNTQSQSENLTFAQTEMSWTDSTVTLLNKDLHDSAPTETSAHTDQHLTPQTDQSVSSSKVLTTSHTQMPTLVRNTFLYPLDGALSSTLKDQQVPRTGLQSTDGFNADLTSTPLKSSSISPRQGSSSTNVDNQLIFSSFSPSARRTQSPNPAEPDTAVGTVEGATFHPRTGWGDSHTSDVPTWTTVSESSDEKSRSTNVLHSLAPSTQNQTTPPGSTESLARSSLWKQTSSEDMQNHVTSTTILFSSDKDVGQTSGDTDSSPTPGAAQSTTIKTSASTATSDVYPPPFSETIPHDNSHTDFTPALSSSTTTDSTLHPATLQTPYSHGSLTTLTSITEPFLSVPPQTSQSPSHHLPSSTNIPAFEQSRNVITATYTSMLTTTKSHKVKGKKKNKFRQWSPTSGPTLHPSQQNRFVFIPSALTTPTWSSKTSPVFYIVPNQPATIGVASVELLLQIIVEDFRSASAPGLEEDTAAWVQPYLQRAPGFSKLLAVWSSGHAVQSLVVFKTSGALQWLGMNGNTSLLEQTGLAQAVHEGRMFRSSKITNITFGGLQGDVCDWLLQCPAGYKCTTESSTTNYSCSSVCRFDYCHHHGICTHHPGQLPVCRCLVGDEFWYMGQRCDMKMTRARLIGACLTILLIITTVIGTLAFVAVRHYRAVLIQAKVDQTRSRFNHFDELSGRFWLRSWAGSADSLDNPAFKRSDELMHLRALDRPCCYHDDTLSLASTCPSHGVHINTIYPHSSQYGWRGSGMSMGDGVLDSGKASDLSVCSWPVEPIHWSPFPILQHLASHRTPKVRVTRPRSYCEGMELVDLGKSWTA